MNECWMNLIRINLTGVSEKVEWQYWNGLGPQMVKNYIDKAEYTHYMLCRVEAGAKQTGPNESCERHSTRTRTHRPMYNVHKLINVAVVLESLKPFFCVFVHSLIVNYCYLPSICALPEACALPLILLILHSNGARNAIENDTWYTHVDFNGKQWRVRIFL